MIKSRESDLKDCLGKYWPKKKEYIDTDKIGIIGGSYGGFMTMAAMTLCQMSLRLGKYGVTGGSNIRSIPAYWESSRNQLYKNG